MKRTTTEHIDLLLTLIHEVMEEDPDRIERWVDKHWYELSAAVLFLYDLKDGIITEKEKK